MEFPATPDSFFESSQGKTHYRYIKVESAQTVLILPGFTIPSAAYATFAKNLSDSGFSVVTIDYFGRGYSEPSSYFDFTLNSYVEQVLNLLAFLKTESVILISFSFSSLIAANIADRKPTLISRLVFISPFHFLRRPMRPFQRFVMSNPLLGPLLLKITAKRFIPADSAAQFHDVSQNEEAYWATVGCCLHELSTNPSFCSSVSRLIGNFSEAAIPDEMLKVTQMSVRTLVLLGEMDKVIDIAESEKWWKHWMPNVTVVTRENVGHLMVLEEPDDTSELVARFVNR